MKYLSVKNRLRAYNVIKQQIRDLESDAEKFSREILAPVRHTVIRLNTYNKAEKTALVIAMCADILAGMHDYIEKLKIAQNLIFEGLQRLPSFEQAVLYCRYVQGMSWSKVASRFDYEERQLQRIACRGLAMLDEIWYSKAS